MSKKLMALAAACLFSIGISAQNSSLGFLDTTIVLQEVVIAGNRLSVPVEEMNRNMETIPASEMKFLPAIALPEILSYQAGVDVRQRGPAGVQSDVGVNAGTFEQTLVMLNGIKMSDPQSGHHLMNLPLMFDNLEKIEILKGAAARKYGQNAYAGAINFITKVPDSNAVSLRSYAGDFGSFGGNASISNKMGKVGSFLSFGADFSDGYRHNTDYKIKNVFYQGELAFSEKDKMDIIFGYTKRSFGANGFYASAKATEQYEDIETTIGSISYRIKKGDWRISPRISWRQNADKYLYIRDNPESYQNYHKTNTYSAEVNASNSNKWGESGIGLEYRKETITGDWYRSGKWSRSNLHGFERENFGAYAEQLFKWKSFIFSPGIFIAWYSDLGWQFFPGASAGFFIHPKLKVIGNIGRSFRIPTFYDQHYSSPNEQGNPELKPEKAWTYEAGLRYLSGKFSMKANAFYRDNSNLIDWVLKEEVWHAENFAKVETEGMELAVQYHKSIPLALGFSIRNFSFSYTKLQQHMQTQEGISRYALEHLTDQFIANVNLELMGNLSLNTLIRHLKRVDQSAYSLLDLKLMWKINKLTAFAEISNVTDIAYKEVMTQMPGRWARMGMQINVPY